MLPLIAVEMVNRAIVIHYSILSLSLSFSLVETQFIDYRFLKDLELRREPKCCCFCVGKELLIYADDKDATAYVNLSIYNTILECTL